MHSHLEAALLGHSSITTNNSSIHNDEDDFDVDEETEILDEEANGENNTQSGTHQPLPRNVTLQMLLESGILHPGPSFMTVEYLGQKFVGDLLSDGKIRGQEADAIYATPSAWAVACKRFVNPEKKSSCGWASIRYRGRKLDAYKNAWYRKKTEEFQHLTQFKDSQPEEQSKSSTMTTTTSNFPRVVVKHNTIANRTVTHDANTLIECFPFSNLGKMQPFLISISTNAALLMDFHCHLTKTEVCGYLAGHWDVNSHNLQVSSAFPCRCSKSDKENAPQIETEIAKTIEREKMILVGWYHSHPYQPAAPTLKDIDAQLDYQIKMKGATDTNYSPCIGIIISPYSCDVSNLESSIISYWVIPPPEAKPNEYGRPMLMSYNVSQDGQVSQTIKDEMKKCVDYYKSDPTFVNFTDTVPNSPNILYVDKLKTSLISKFPRDESELSVWSYVKECLGFPQEENDTLLSIPSITKPPLLPNLNSNLMLSADISSMLFHSGKFPTTSSLFNLPDPMAHSTLAANNMFLSSSLFKMQELLKTQMKTNVQQPPIKIPSTIDVRPLMKIPTTNTDVSPSKSSTNSKSDLSTVVTTASESITTTTKSENVIGKKQQEFVAPAELNFNEYLSLNMPKKQDSSSSANKDFPMLDLSVSGQKLGNDDAGKGTNDNGQQEVLNLTCGENK